MLDWLALIHRQEMERYYSSTVLIQRWNGTTWVTVGADIPAHVQLPRASDSSDDPDVATTEEMSAVMVYMRWDTDVQPGDRLFWTDEWWTVNGVTGERTAEVNRVASCSRSQSALIEEPIEFRRRQDGAWVDLGIFMMRFTLRPPAPQLPPVEQTAAGQSMQASMIGGPESDVLQVGDWFGRAGMPGRILMKDNHEPDHIEFTYEMEMAVP